MKKNGFLLIELIISIAFIMIICIAVFSVAIHINSLTNKKISDDTYNKDLALIYKEIAYVFSTKNISSISYEEYTVDEIKGKYINVSYDDGNKPLEIDFYNNILIIDGQKFESSKSIKYTDISIQKVMSSTNENYSYITLTIHYNTPSIEDGKAKLYYVNNPVTTIYDIETICY